jgi:hypothetical protein
MSMKLGMDITSLHITKNLYFLFPTISHTKNAAVRSSEGMNTGKSKSQYLEILVD